MHVVFVVNKKALQVAKYFGLRREAISMDPSVHTSVLYYAANKLSTYRSSDHL